MSIHFLLFFSFCALIRDDALDPLAKAKQTMSDGSSSGRFFLINNILCKTADGDGSFSPQLVFGKGLPSTVSSSPRSPNGASVIVDPSCFVLGSFGIASGSALLDSYGRTITDATDDVCLIPGPLSNSEKTSKPAEDVSSSEHVEEFCAALEQFPVAQRNEALYQQGGKHVLLVPEAAYTLFSSCESINGLHTTTTPISYPRSFGDPSKHWARAIRSASVVWTTLCSYKDQLPNHKKEGAAWKSRIVLLERVRWLQKSSPLFVSLLESLHSKCNLQARGQIVRSFHATTSRFDVPEASQQSFLTFSSGHAKHCFTDTNTVNWFTPLASICKSFRLSRKEARKKSARRSKLRVSIYIIKPLKAWTLFYQYYSYLKVLAFDSLEGMTFDFDSPFSCSEALKGYAAQSRPKATRSEVSLAWDYLLHHRRNALFFRMTRLSAYIEKLQDIRSGVL